MPGIEGIADADLRRQSWVRRTVFEPQRSRASDADCGAAITRAPVPTLPPDAHQLDDRPEILSRRRQPVERGDAEGDAARERTGAPGQRSRSATNASTARRIQAVGARGHGA